jgi:hypothetical protein
MRTTVVSSKPRKPFPFGGARLTGLIVPFDVAVEERPSTLSLLRGIEDAPKQIAKI